MVVDKVPVFVVRTDGIPFGEPSQVSRIQSLTGKVVPMTVTDWPATAAAFSVRTAVPADVAKIGSARTGRSRRMGSVATHSRRRELRWGVGPSGAGEDEERTDSGSDL